VDDGEVFGSREEDDADANNDAKAAEDVDDEDKADDDAGRGTPLLKR